MTQRDDLLGRLKELHTGTKAHRATSRVIRAMIFDGDYASASTALDTLEDTLHPALAGGGGGGAFVGATLYGDVYQELPSSTSWVPVLWGAGAFFLNEGGFVLSGTDPNVDGILVSPENAGLYVVEAQLSWVFGTPGAGMVAVGIYIFGSAGEANTSVADQMIAVGTRNYQIISLASRPVVISPNEDNDPVQLYIQAWQESGDIAYFQHGLPESQLSLHRVGDVPA